VLDAQWFGVAQRRRRVFVVADFRGQRAGQILALADGLRRHPAPRRETGQGVTTGTAPSLTASGRGTSRVGESRGLDPVIPVVGSQPFMLRTHNLHDDERGDVWFSDLPGTLQARGDTSNQMQAVVTHTLSAEGHDASEDGTGRGTPLVPTYALQGGGHTSQGSQGSGWNEDVCFTLNNVDQHAIAWVGSYGGGGGEASDSRPTLQASGGTDDRGVRNPLIATATMDVHPTLAASTGGPGSQDWRQHSAVASGMAVRRLTPVECCRLQAFPDDWLDLDPPLADSTKYRMLGNAVCVAVSAWLANRIAAAVAPDGLIVRDGVLVSGWAY
jgi:DNA (cytosine-5)-methyltransferase 1